MRRFRRVISLRSIVRRRSVVALGVAVLAITTASTGLSGALAAGASVHRSHNSSEGHKLQGSPFTVCAITATSGPFVELGHYDVLGAYAWAKEINRHGGLLGHKVVIVTEDDNSDPATAASLVRKCVEQVHANVIFGPEETSDAAAAIPVANQLHELLIGWQSGWGGQGIPTSDLTSYSFPVQGNIFLEDDTATVLNLIVPRHYTRVAVVQDNTTGGKPNAAYTAGLGKKYHFKVVDVQTLTPGATDDTPAALALLKANPQIIVLGTTPGPDTITIIKAIRAQDPSIPISECSGCALPSFIQAVGGPKAMHNVYLIGTPGDILKLPKTKGNLPAITATKQYIAAMKAGGYGSTDDIDQSSEGYDSGVELPVAAKAAGSLSTNALMKAMRQEKVVTGGLLSFSYRRTPTNYNRLTRVVAAMDTVASNGKLVVVAG